MMKLSAVVSSPLDCHADLTVPAQYWVDASGDAAERQDRESIFRRAERLAASVADLIDANFNEHREGESRRVGYSPEIDGPFFLFKLDNNGTTIVVAERALDVKDKVMVLGRSSIHEN